jgi:hypothetical protein
MLACDVCSKEFRRRDNMIRHKKTLHDQKEEEEDEPAQSDSESTISVSEESDTDIDTSVEEEEDENEEVDPWQGIVDKAFEKCQHLYEDRVHKLKQRHVKESDARQETYEDMIATYRKAIMNIFTTRMVWFTAMQEDSIYKAIKKTADDLKILDDYGHDESWKYATSKRKYLFDKILDKYDPPDVDESEDESPEKRRKLENNELS